MCIVRKCCEYFSEVIGVGFSLKEKEKSELLK